MMIRAAARIAAAFAAFLDPAWLAAATVGAVLAALSGGARAAPAAPAPQAIQQVAEQTIKRLDLQTEFPQGAEPFHLTLPPEVLWLVIAVAVAVLAYGLRDLLPFGRMTQGDAWQSDDVAAAAGAGGSPAVILQMADDLAANGRFAEAMHVLLLRALADIRHRLDEQFADSLTSREILRGTRLREETRAPLRDVVTRVELTYFGDRPAAQADYLACRASFNDFARSLEGSAPA